MFPRTKWLLLMMGLLLESQVSAADAPSQEQVQAALARASGFFQQEVASGGGYVYAYSGDLTLREGEGKAEKNVIWVQPPGTPAVGEAFLDAYEATRDELHLQGAYAAANALVRGQLQSGGWNYHVIVEGDGRRTSAYRADHPGDADPNSQKPGKPGAGWDVWKQRKGKGNITTLDDDTTQAATRFLIRTDKALKFKDQPIHEAALYALSSLLNAQYANGGWSANHDRYPTNPPNEQEYPIIKASYQETWSWTWTKDFTGCYVTNDNLMSDMIDTMLLAAEVYGDKKYIACAEKAGDFLILAQMPEPQRAWAQQYDAKMQPCWSRAFEPPAISGGESQAILEALLRLYRATGKRKYLEPIPPALAWMKKSALPDDRLARFYELKTNKPLYFVKQADGREVLTYSSDDLPTHYGFIVSSRANRIEKEYQKVLRGSYPKKDNGQIGAERSGKVSDETAARVRKVMGLLDGRGAWVERGKLRTYAKHPEGDIIRSQTFINNVRLLSGYLNSLEK
ncbi:MAG: pectate lyase [Pirellulaceae bacterium]